MKTGQVVQYDPLTVKDHRGRVLLIGLLVGLAANGLVVLVAIIMGHTVLSRLVHYETVAVISTEEELPTEVVEEEPPAEDESTSQQAGGEEGVFGQEDLEDESIVPDHEGPMVDELQSTELGRALDQALTESGTLQSIFQSNDLTTGFGQDFATAGEGDAFIVGRGTGGLGIRGTGRGGGGEGFGRVHGVGDIDTGGGRGVSAGLGRREQRAPRAHVERGIAEVNGFLSREEIERVVRRHSRGFRYCYERELQDDPELAGQITVNWTIDLDGTVSRSSIEENTMDNRNVESCVLREVRRMRFPEPDGGMVVVRYPFTFRSSQDEGGGDEE